jgi:hypothetical protein
VWPKEKRNTAHGVYRELDDIEFPMAEVNAAVDDSPGGLGQFLKHLAASLKVPFGAVLLGMISLASFMAHRTMAQYTPMLGVPPLPWLIWLGNSGEGKSKLIWWMKQVIKECEKRATMRALRKYKNQRKQEKEEKEKEKVQDPPPQPQPEQGADAGLESASDAEEEPTKRSKAPGKLTFCWDTGTLFGAGALMSANQERCFAILHETKRVLKAIVNDTPGNSPDSFIKLYDRDDFCNSVLGVGSKFINENPFFPLFGGSHLEDYHELFGTPTVDALGVHYRCDSFHLFEEAPGTLADFGLIGQCLGDLFMFMGPNSSRTGSRHMALGASGCVRDMLRDVATMPPQRNKDTTGEGPRFSVVGAMPG